MWEIKKKSEYRRFFRKKYDKLWTFYLVSYALKCLTALKLNKKKE